MGLVFYISVYFIIWWLVLFVILPLGMRSHAEEGVQHDDGGDPGAPINPNLKRKFFTTSWIAAIVLAVVAVVLETGMLQPLALPGG